jgi:peptidylprolyl isomerase
MQKLIVSLLTISMGCKTTSQTINELNQQSKIMTTASGVKIEITHKGNGIKPAEGDKVTVHYTGRLTDGTRFDSSVDRNSPFSFNVGTGQVIQGWDEAFLELQQGDKAIITIPPDAGYGSRAVGSIPANSTLVFEVELLSVKPKIKAIPYDVSGKDTQKLPSGLEYIMIKNGSGKQAAAGAMVSVHYSGYLSDGSLFDSSVERGEPIEFRLGEGRVIQGWEQGIGLLKVGSQCRLIIPYPLGYGEQGYPPVIPAKSTLIFDVELMDVY